MMRMGRQCMPGRAPVAAVLLLVLGGSAQAAWVWVCQGKRSVERLPKEGRASWESLPDDDGDGRPNPVIAHVSLRLLDAEGEPTAKLRIGSRGTLEVTPEFGAVDTDLVEVSFEVEGPEGPYPVTPSPQNAEPIAAAVFPPVVTATIEVPEELEDRYFGGYTFTAHLTVRGIVGPDYVEPLRFEIAGKSRSQRIREAFQEGVEAVAGGAARVGREIGKAWDRAFRRDRRVPTRLRRLSGEDATALAAQLIEAPGAPWEPHKERLSAERSAASAARAAERRWLVWLANGALQPVVEGAPREYELGWLVYADVVLTREAEPPAPYTVTLEDETLSCLHLKLDAQPEVPVVHVLAHDEVELGTVTVRQYQVLTEPPKSFATELSVKRQPEDDKGGLVRVVNFVDTGGAVLRVEYDLPLLPVLPPELPPEEITEPAAAEEAAEATPSGTAEPEELPAEPAEPPPLY